jgi:hypothetical protein
VVSGEAMVAPDRMDRLPISVVESERGLYSNMAQVERNRLRYELILLMCLLCRRYETGRQSVGSNVGTLCGPR